MTKTVEAVTFKLTAGTDVSAFVAANGKVNDWVRQQPGFLTRELSQMEDGTWLDVVHWTSIVEARQAAETLMSELADSEFIAMIDPSSIKMSHGELRVAIQAA